MKIREAVQDICSECHRFKKNLVEESYGCDNCKKPIDEQLNNPDNQHRHYLEVSVFHIGAETDHLQFCSWKCVLEKLPKLKTDHFITLPYMTFDNSLEKGIRAQDLVKLLKRI